MIVRLNFIRAGLFHLFSDGLSVKGSYTTEKQAIWRFITSKNPDQWLQTSVGSVADVNKMLSEREHSLRRSVTNWFYSRFASVF